MAIIDMGSKADFHFQVDGGPKDKLRVLSFFVSEGISQPFRVQLELVSKDHEVDFDSQVGKPALLTVAGADNKRFVNGIVLKFEQVSRGKDFSTYKAEVVPEFFLLSFRARCRIFQNKKVKDIVEQVLKDAGIAPDRFRFSLKESYPEREYCVQYRESDFHFISRLLEEEGIFYFFEQAEDKHVLVMGDSVNATTLIQKPNEIEFRPATGQVESKEVIGSFSCSQEMRTGAFSLRDYNYDTPDNKMENTETAKRDAGLQVDDYPGKYDESGVGKRLTKVRLDEHQGTRLQAAGKGGCRHFIPGYRFKMTHHSRKDFNKEYLITGLQQRGTQPQSKEHQAGDATSTYENIFTCIPNEKDVIFRPERTTPRPFVRGIQTAVVVGPSGEKVWMDKKGRAKVMFHWDREGKKDEKCSCWVRVSQGYAGPTHGAQFPPLIGDEVIVDFVEGDPDRPLITGRVYNENNKPPLKPEDRIQNVIYTPYQHRLILDDKKASITLHTGGSETVHLGDAEEDSDFGNNIKISTADGHFLHLAKGDQHKGIMAKTEAEHMIEMRDDPDPGIFLVDKDGTLYIHLDTQNQTINIINDTSTEINVKCDGGTVNVKSGEINVDGGNKINLTAGTEIALSAPQIKVDGKTSVEVKAPQVKIEGSGTLQAKGGMTTIEGSGTAELKGGAMTTIQGALVKIN